MVEQVIAAIKEVIHVCLSDSPTNSDLYATPAQPGVASSGSLDDILKEISKLPETPDRETIKDSKDGTSQKYKIPEEPISELGKKSFFCATFDSQSLSLLVSFYGKIEFLNILKFTISKS